MALKLLFVVLACQEAASLYTPRTQRRHAAFASTAMAKNAAAAKKLTPFLHPTRGAPRTATSLAAVPTWALYSLGHVVAGTSNAPVVTRALKWYRRIALPSWTPPDSVFAPIWTVLYSLMGVSVSRIATSGSALTRTATQLWMFHFALNISWAPVFFGFQNLRLGLVINALLLLTLGSVLVLFARIDPLSAYLQIPYLCWLVCATILNRAVCRLNPTVGGKNAAVEQAELCSKGEGYNDAMLQYDLKGLQAAAAKHAGV